MYATHAAKATAGSKPVAHQAPIVISARLRRRELGPNTEPELKGDDGSTSEVNELAFVESNGFSQYPEPEYFTAVNTVPSQFRLQNPSDKDTEAKPERKAKPGDKNDQKVIDVLKACWKQYSFLGVVQTPGSNKGLSRHDVGALGGNTNVVHAGGTMTTINHGPDTIKVNDTVAWFFPASKLQDATPRCWQGRGGAPTRLRAGVFKVTPGTAAYKSAREHGAIVGRAISAASQGAQLDLILTV
jgi:hypothetical protein